MVSKNVCDGCGGDVDPGANTRSIDVEGVAKDLDVRLVIHAQRLGDRKKDTRVGGPVDLCDKCFASLLAKGFSAKPKAKDKKTD